MSSIDRGFWGGTVAELERLAGPLQQGPASVSAFDVLEGTYRGHRLRASWLGRIRSGTAPPGSTLRLGLSLGDRPIRTYVWSRKGSSIFGPTATTGDPVFDDRYIAAAIPSEVVSAAFDAEVRAMIDRRWNGRDTSLDASDGWVSIAAGRSTPGLAGSATPPTPEELGQVLDDLVLVAARLIAAYDTRRAAVAAEGPEAAAQWERAAHDAVSRANTKSRGLALVAVVILLVVMGLIVAAVLAVS